MLLATMIVLFTAYGMRVSCTGSLPIGLYQAVPGEIELGSIVGFCPDLTNPVIQAGRERGYLSPGLLTCEGGIAPLLKYILALPGDRVEVSQENLRVNGHAIENSARLAVDGAGRPMPSFPASGEVPPGHAWVFSNYTPGSFDSRYFGSIKASAILGKMKPVAVLE